MISHGAPSALQSGPSIQYSLSDPGYHFSFAQGEALDFSSASFPEASLHTSDRQLGSSGSTVALFANGEVPKECSDRNLRAINKWCQNASTPAHSVSASNAAVTSAGVNSEDSSQQQKKKDSEKEEKKKDSEKEEKKKDSEKEEKKKDLAEVREKVIEKVIDKATKTKIQTAESGHSPMSQLKPHPSQETKKLHENAEESKPSAWNFLERLKALFRESSNNVAGNGSKDKKDQATAPEKEERHPDNDLSIDEILKRDAARKEKEQQDALSGKYGL